MNSMRREAIMASKELDADTAAADLIAGGKAHCGSEQLRVLDEPCDSSDDFGVLKAEFYARLAPIAAKVARDASRSMQADGGFTENPTIRLDEALNNAFDDFYLSVDTAGPVAEQCPHHQDLEHIVRPGVHTAVVVIDMTMLHLEIANLTSDSHKAGRLIQRLALLHTDSVPDVVQQLEQMAMNNSPAIIVQQDRMEFAPDFAEFVLMLELRDADKPRLGCPLMFDAAALRELWSAYGDYYAKYQANLA